MRIHILGICGTFMAGIARIAIDAGHTVTGSDLNVYPPMSDQLESLGVQLLNVYDPTTIPRDVDQVIVGNVISRGNPAMEAILDEKIPFISGPQWLSERILKDRWVLAVSGTHGKTTTTSMLAWILEHAGLNPGFLVGGVPENFGISARLGKSPFFVIEADEYDSAFFDKRSKFIHYHPKTLILNNLEFDHADIFPDLAAIQQQFHYLIRTVPGNGQIIQKENDMPLQQTIAKGCWTPIVTFGSNAADWQATLRKADGSHFVVSHDGHEIGEVVWSLTGTHNVNNALAAIAAAHHAGVSPEIALSALPLFKNVKRRLEIRGQKNNTTVYDDFAHHPTAIETTLAGLRAKVGDARIIAVLELGSYTMRSGVHNDTLPGALKAADLVFCQRPVGDSGGLEESLQKCSQSVVVLNHVDELVDQISKTAKPGDHILVMSNSSFGGIHEKLLGRLSK